MAAPRASSSVRVHCFTEPNFGENAYVVDGGTGSECWIIDPGLPPSARQILEYVGRERLRPTALILTHAHADHIVGVPEILAAYAELPVRIAAGERRLLTDPDANLSGSCGLPFTVRPETLLDLEPPGPLRLNDTQWAVLDVSGHSPDGRALYCAAAGAAIVGDALFEGSIGRTDFPGSDHERLIRNIRAHLLTLPEETVVYSGHGPATTIGREKRGNPWLA